MAKARPGSGRPPNRRGRGGVGPGPGYRPNPYTGGKKAGGYSAVPTAPVIGIAFALFLGLPAGVLGLVGWYFVAAS